MMRELRADRYHAGLRIVTLAAWLASIGLVFVLLRWVVAAVAGRPISGVGVLIVAAVAVAAAQPLAWLIERQLLARWPSGRAAQLEAGGLTWRERGQAARLHLRQPVNFWRWRFQIRRRRGGRIPTGHHCLALRLVQGDTDVIVYSFAPPPVAEALAADYPFYTLRSSGGTSKPALGGRDAIYLAAEHARWDSGAELEPGDFRALLDHLAAHLPEFKAAPASSV